MMVRCPKHGRVFDNDKAMGCPLCMQGVEATEGRTRAPLMSRAAAINLVILAVLLLSAGVAYVVFLREPPPPPVVPVVIDTMALLDEGELFAEASDRSPIRQARAYAAALERLYVDRAAVLRAAEVPPDTTVGTRAARARARRYYEFAERWQQRVEAAKPDSQLFYRPGVAWATQLESVNNYLGAARSGMRQTLSVAGAPPVAERRAHFSAARGYLNSARTLLSEMP